MPLNIATRILSRIGAAAVVAALLFVLPSSAPGKPGGFRLWSPNITGPKLGMDQVYNGMGCTGKNISPELRWSGAPAETKSFAVTVYDPDAPTGSGWWHWVVYNIPSTAVALPVGAGSTGSRGLPAGATQGNTDFGQPGYGGACPSTGDKPHRYFFTVYALNVPRIDVPAGASPAMIGFNVHAHTVGKASFVARYGR